MENLIVEKITIPMNLLFKDLSKRELLYIVLKNINDYDNLNIIELDNDILRNYDNFNKIPLKKILSNDIKKDMLVRYIYDKKILKSTNKNLLITQLYHQFPMENEVLDINLKFNQCIYEILSFKYKNLFNTKNNKLNLGDIYNALVSNSKPICSLLYNIILLGKLKNNNLGFVGPEDEDLITAYLKEIFVINLINLNNEYLDWNLNTFENLCKLNEKNEKKIQKSQEKINTYKEKIKDLNNKYKSVNKKNQELLKYIEDEIENKVYENKKNSKEQLEEINKLKNKIIELEDKNNILNNTNKVITNENLVLNKLINSKEKQLSEHDKNSDNIILNYLKTNGLTHDLFNILKPYIDIYIENNKIKNENKDENTITPANNIIEKNKEKELGYCIFKENKIFIVFSDNSIHELKNLPDNVYITENQFVLVNNRIDCSFVWAYNCKHDNLFNILGNYEFALVEKRGEKIFINKFLGNLETLEADNRINRLNDLQIVAIDQNNKLIRYYKIFKPLLNDFKLCIEQKKQIPFFVLKTLNNGYFVRNIFSNEEIFLELDNSEIKNQDIIILNENKEVVKIFNFSVFYTLSPLYKYKSFGYINIIDGVYFIKKVSGENVILNHVPPTHTFEEGDNVCIDEFNNYLYSETYKEEELKNKDKIKKKKIKNNNNVNNIEDDSIFKNVLILGKPTYENSYKLALYKNHYKCQLVDGYSAWNKINSALNEKDIVVVITKFISHENMWKIKKECSLPIIFSEYDGANRIVEQLNEKI